MKAPQVQASPTVTERLVALEERTTPKPKTILDRLKDWGGLVSLIIAIGYSFPIGIWDRFIEPEKRRVASEIQTIRSVIEGTTTMLSEGARTLASIQDPFLYDTAARAINTRIFLQMNKHRLLFEKHKKALTPPELIMIGNNFTMTGQPDAALPFIITAQENAGLDVQTKVEAMRQRAKILFSEGPLQNRQESRKYFNDAISIMSPLPTMKYASMSLLAEWALFELLDGDWACGQEKLAEAKTALNELSPYMNDNGNFAKLISQRTQSLSLRPGQTTTGCQ